MKSGNAAGTTVGSAVELHGITAANYKNTNLFEGDIPMAANGDDIACIVVENWSYDIFGVREMADIFSSTAAMKTEIRNYLTSPGAGVATTTTFEGSIRNKIAELNFTNATEAERTTLKYRRSIYVVKDIGAGENISEQNIRSIRPSHGLAPKHIKDLIGKRATKDIKRGTPLNWDLIEK